MDEGEIVVPVDPRYIGLWLTGLFGDPVSSTVAASGYFDFAVNPSDQDTITLGGTVWTFVSGASSGDETQIQATATQTIDRLVTDLNASADGNVSDATYSRPAGTQRLQVVQDTAGARATPSPSRRRRPRSAAQRSPAAGIPTCSPPGVTFCRATPSRSATSRSRRTFGTPAWCLIPSRWSSPAPGRPPPPSSASRKEKSDSRPARAARPTSSTSAASASSRVRSGERARNRPCTDRCSRRRSRASPSETDFFLAQVLRHFPGAALASHKVEVNLDGTRQPGPVTVAITSSKVEATPAQLGAHSATSSSWPSQSPQAHGRFRDTATSARTVPAPKPFAGCG